MEIVLASASPRRSALLREWGIAFRAMPARGVDESAAAGRAPEVAARLARQKAESVLEGLAASGGPASEGAARRGAANEGGAAGEAAGGGLLVIGADTVVELDGKVLGKPRDRDEARAMIRELAGRTHRVFTGVAVVRPGGAPRVEVEASEVSMRPLAAADVEAYLSTGDWEGKAGAYGIQSEGRRLVSGFRGCYTNIVGLPMRRLLSLLEAEGAGPAIGGARRQCDCAGNALWRGGEGCLPASGGSLD